MEYKKTNIEGVWIMEPKVFNDNRGYFYEVWKQSDFDKNIGKHVEFVQDNESKSTLECCEVFTIKKENIHKQSWYEY